MKDLRLEFVQDGVGEHGANDGESAAELDEVVVERGGLILVVAQDVAQVQSENGCHWKTN